MTTEQVNFLELTELAGDEVSQEQVDRLYQRYQWAATYSAGRHVCEVACGTGQGLGCLGAQAAFLAGADYEVRMLTTAKRHYGRRYPLLQLDAQALPFAAESLDVVVLFEAIYYLPSAERFIAECHRVLRQGGHVLIASANKDLFDFNPSPHSHRYYGVTELGALMAAHGFLSTFMATTPVAAVSGTQRLLRPVKKAAVAMGLMPRSMAGKKLLKRLVFGGLVPMPAEVAAGRQQTLPAPTPIPADAPDRTHKVILCAAMKQ